MLGMKKSIGYILMVVVVIIDLLTKHWITSTLKVNQAVEIIPNFFWLTNVQNTGAAWSILRNQTWILTIISLLATVGLFYLYQTKAKTFWQELGLALMVAGTFGNLIDRMFLGAVRDFLSFNIFGYMWPVFNVADMALVIGVGCIILDMVVNPNA